MKKKIINFFLLNRFSNKLLKKLIYSQINIYLIVKKIFQKLDFLIHDNEAIGLSLLKIKKKEIIIDVGAGQGAFYKTLKNINIKNKVIAIEPLIENKCYLEKLKEKNSNFKYYINHIGKNNLTFYTPTYQNKRIDNFTSYSKKKIINNLRFNKFNLNYKKIYFIKKKSQAININKFKNLKISLIKIDTEGYENQTINKCKYIIKKNYPILYVEYNKKNMNAENTEIYKKFLKKINYSGFFYNYQNKKFEKKNSLNQNNIYFFQRSRIKKIPL
jgi:FkbM family methyltransferase